MLVYGVNVHSTGTKGTHTGTRGNREEMNRLLLCLLLFFSFFFFMMIVCVIRALPYLESDAAKGKRNQKFIHTEI